MTKLDLDTVSISDSPSMYALSGGVIQGLPQVNQLNEPTSDHLADENARMNCVFTSNASVSRKVGGHPEANGDAIKDGCAEYGQNYTGGASEDVIERDHCLEQKWGIKAEAFHASNRNDLLNHCKAQADAGNFSLVTIPSAWNSQPTQSGYNPDSPNFWTHCCVYCGYEGDTHYLMNPWGGFIMTYSSADLALRLCFLEVFTMSAVAAPAPTPSPVQQGPTMIVLDHDANGHLSGAHDQDHPNVHVGLGVAALIQKNNQLDHKIVDFGAGADGRHGERSFGTRTVTVLANASSADSLYTYSDQFGTVSARGVPDLAIAFLDVVAAADKAAATPAAPPAPTVDVAGLKTDVGAALNALNDANKKLGA